MKRKSRSRSRARSVRRVLIRRNKTRSSTMARRKTRRGRSGGSSGISPTKIVVGGVVYGAARQKIASVLSPLTDKAGVLGNLADNVVLGGLAWYGTKKLKGTAKAVAQAALAVEAASAGAELTAGLSTSTTSTVGGVF